MFDRHSGQQVFHRKGVTQHRKAGAGGAAIFINNKKIWAVPGCITDYVCKTPFPTRDFAFIERGSLIATEDDNAEIVGTLDELPVVAMMLRLAIPLTRENYIRMNYWEDKELSAEEESELPELFKDRDDTEES
jgi:hypothetical protein